MRPRGPEKILLQIVINGLFRNGVQHPRVPVSVHHPRYIAVQAKLQTLRKAAGISQEELADQLAVGQSFVSKIERGEAYVDILVFFDWCEACGANAGAVVSDLISHQLDPKLPLER